MQRTINSYTNRKSTRLLFVKMVLLVDVVTQVSRVEEIHQQEKALPVLERKLHVHDKEVGVGFEFGEKLFFVHN